MNIDDNTLFVMLYDFNVKFMVCKYNKYRRMLERKYVVVKVLTKFLTTLSY